MHKIVQSPRQNPFARVAAARTILQYAWGNPRGWDNASLQVNKSALNMRVQLLQTILNSDIGSGAREIDGAAVEAEADEGADAPE